MPKSTPADMQSVVRIHHRGAGRGDTLEMLMPDTSPGGNGLKNIEWYKDITDKKLIGLPAQSVGLAIIPIMEVVTGQTFVLTEERKTGLSIWERVDYLKSQGRMPPAKDGAS